MIVIRRCACTAALLLLIAGGVSGGAATAPGPVKRIAFIIDSWYPNSHPDVIGTRLLNGYRVGETSYTSSVTIASVYSRQPRASDMTKAVAGKYGFRVASSVADALLDNPQSSRPTLLVDGVFIGTEEDLPRSGQPLRPSSRLETFREVLGVLDRAGSRVPIFLDKMLAVNWQDSRTIVEEAGQRYIPLMAGSVLSYAALERPLRSGKAQVGVVISGGPYWAFAFHAAELLQRHLEQRGPRETGVSMVSEVGTKYWSLPDRAAWGAELFDALLRSARTPRGVRAPAVPQGLGPDTYVVLIQYNDGARGVLAFVPYALSEAEFLVGLQYQDGSTSLGGIVLPRQPFDHFGYLARDLVEFFTSGRATVPVERTLLTTGIVLSGHESRERRAPVTMPSLSISYTPAATGR